MANWTITYIWLWLGLPGGPVVKNLPAMQKTQEAEVRSLGLEDPWNRKWQPSPVFLPEKFHGQGSLAGYSPWSGKESMESMELQSMEWHLYDLDSGFL